MNHRRTTSVITLLFCLILLFSTAVSSARARLLPTDMGANPAIPAQPAAKEARHYNAALFTASWGVTPDMLISCDPGNDLLLRVNPGQVRSTNSLQASACRRQAANDAAAARTILAGAPADQAAPSAAASPSGVSASSGCGSGYGVTGDGRNLKVYSGYSDTRYVFLQCGKKVAEYGPATCSCSSNFRYTYSCKKPPTVYITLPCR